MQNGRPDIFDLKILDILQRDGRMELDHISARVHKSRSSVHERIKKLTEKGYIEGFVAVLNRKLLGRPTVMVTLVKLKQHDAQTRRDFPAAMAALPEVLSCLNLSGEHDYLLQISLKDPSEYEDFLDQKLCVLPMVDKVQSSLVLKEYKSMSPIPLP